MRKDQLTQQRNSSKRITGVSRFRLRHGLLSLMVAIFAISISASGLLNAPTSDTRQELPVEPANPATHTTVQSAQHESSDQIASRTLPAEHTRAHTRKLIVELGSGGCGIHNSTLCVVIVEKQADENSPALTHEQADEILESLRFEDFYNMALLFESMTPEEAYLLYRYTEFCEGAITNLDEYHNALDNVHYWFDRQTQHDFMQARIAQIDDEFFRCDGFDVESGFELVTAQFHWMNVAALGHMSLAQESYYETIYDLFSINSDLILSNPDLAHEFRQNAQAILSALSFSSPETGFGQFATAYIDGIVVPQDDYQALIYTLAASFESDNPGQYDDQITSLAMSLSHEQLTSAEQAAYHLSVESDSEKSTSSSYQAEKM